MKFKFALSFGEKFAIIPLSVVTTSAG